MRDPPTVRRDPDSPATLAKRGVAVGGDNPDVINTRVIINIHGDNIRKNCGIVRTILTRALLAPPLEPIRNKAIAGYFPAAARSLQVRI